jgi:hypothetical protein
MPRPRNPAPITPLPLIQALSTLHLVVSHLTRHFGLEFATAVALKTNINQLKYTKR